jgi:hypothetical protein
MVLTSRWRKEKEKEMRKTQRVMALNSKIRILRSDKLYLKHIDLRILNPLA